MDIKTLVMFDEVLPVTQARLLMGPAGIGKSSIIKAIGKTRGARVIDIRLSEYEPQDLVGFPFIDKLADGSAVTRFAQPWWWPTNSEEKVILFLDEVDRCKEDMQPAAMQLTLDRTAGGRKLPDNVIVWAACNGEKYMTAAIDQALVNRFAVVEFTPSAEEWLAWAEGAKIHRSVVDYIRNDRKRLDTPESLIGKPNVVVPSRRSWANLGAALNNLAVQVTECEELHLFASAFVGLTEALTFATWVKEKFQVLSPDDIYSGKAKAFNLNMLQVGSVVDEIAGNFLDKSRTRTEQYNCLKFFMDAGHEAFGALFSALPSEAAFVLSEFDDVNDYIESSRSVLAQYVSDDQPTSTAA